MTARNTNNAAMETLEIAAETHSNGHGTGTRDSSRKREVIGIAAGEPRAIVTTSRAEAETTINLQTASAVMNNAGTVVAGGAIMETGFVRPTRKKTK